MFCCAQCAIPAHGNDKGALESPVRVTKIYIGCKVYSMLRLWF